MKTKPKARTHVITAWVVAWRDPGIGGKGVYAFDRKRDALLIRQAMETKLSASCSAPLRVPVPLPPRRVR